ncbi:MAG: asparagine synthase (glutamine-hydrolyzing) [Terriglobales bacterium]
MCGICGTLNYDRRRRVDARVLEAMSLRIRHRGPDDDGAFTDANLGLAMRRLCIVDLKTGHQPLSNEDGTLWLVYNGEIYNHLDLRADLESRGHRYSTHTDSETVVHLYEEYGRGGFARLEGMFAFALWDQRRRVLLLARDGLGIKPLYYWHDGERLIFASEIKAILAHPEARAELEPKVLPEYLAFGYYSGEECFFRGIRKLMPGHWLEAGEDGRVRTEQYWDLPAAVPDRRRSRDFYVAGYRDRLEAAVQRHLMSDVPLGVFLSGGMDSSAIAALTAKLRGGAIETFSVGYDDVRYSELPYAAEVARHIGSRHHEVHVGRDQFFSALPQLIWQEDEPLCWPSSVPLYFLAQRAKEHVTVVLTGEGSDETQAGYARYAMTLWNRRLDRYYRALVPSRLRRAQRSRFHGKLRHSFLAVDGGDICSLYFDNFLVALPAREQANLLSPELRMLAPDAYRNPLQYWNLTGEQTPLLQRMLETDIRTYLVELLMRQDAMSMAASLESRVPFLDRHVVEFALRIPAHVQVRGLVGKQVLKAAVADLLPQSILNRKKAGFPTPWQVWLQGPGLVEVERLIAGPRAQARGLLRPEAVRALLDEQRRGRARNEERLWRLANLELWQRVFLDADPAFHAGGLVGASARWRWSD